MPARSGRELPRTHEPGGALAVWRGVALPILGGVFVAVAVAALWSLNPLWVGFVLFGVAACVPAFMVRRGSGYWLAVFLLVLPFNLHKFFGTKEHVAKLLETVGGTAGSPRPLLGGPGPGLRVRRAARVWRARG